MLSLTAVRRSIRLRPGARHFVLCCAFAGLAAVPALAQSQPLFTFAQISDSQPQTTEENQNFVDVLQTLAEAGQAGALLPRPIDLVLFAGDITWGNTAPEWIAATQKLDTWLTANGIPYRAVPGNHDVNNSDTSLYEFYIAESDPWEIGSAAFTGHNGQSGTTCWQGLRFIGFNNSNPSSNTISAADVTDISARVSAAQAAGENAFLLCHHPHNESSRLPLVNVLPNPAVIGYLRGHTSTPHVTQGLSGIVNPNVWDTCTNAVYRDRALIYYEVFQTQLKAHVVFIDAPFPAPIVMPLLFPLSLLAEPDYGIEGLVHANARPQPSGEAPERKLWHRSGTWWGILWSDAESAYRIQRLQIGTQTWTDGGTTVSTDSGRSFDALASGDTLWVATNVPTVPSTAGNGSPGELLRFTYNSVQERYNLDAGFPVALNDARSETLVIARDSLGTLWATWTEGGSVLVNHTVGGDDAVWGMPFALAGVSGLAAEETSAIAAFDGRIGILWPKSATGTLSLSLHTDGDPDGVWTTETALSNGSLVGDQIDLAADQARALAAVRGSSGALTLVERSVAVPGAGVYTAHEVAASTVGLHDPVLVVDQAFARLRLYATGPTLEGQSMLGGGAIYEKLSPLAAIDFTPGLGTPLIQDGLDPAAGSATTTRSAVDGASDLVVLSSNAQTETYWHAFDGLASLPAAPTSNFTGTPTSGPAPHAVSFDDLSTGGPTDWLWDFGDGATSTEDEPVHVYAAPGTYTVALRVANGAGENTFTRADYVVVTPPPSSATFEPIADARVKQANPNSNYGLDTILRVRLEPTDSYESFLKFDLSSLAGGVTSARLRLYCTDGSPAGGLVYSLTNHSWTETGITWNNKPGLPALPVADFGPVSAGFYFEADVTEAITGPGLYSFALSGGSSNSALYTSREGGNRPELVVEFPGAGMAPTADFVGSPLSGDAPLLVSFTDLSTDGPTSWSWDFGDTGTSTEQHPMHVYTVPGVYTVTLEATNSAGLGALTLLDYITVQAAPPVADFTGTPLTGFAPLQVTFTDSSTGAPTSWDWDFGDQTSSTQQNPVHVYSEPGTYDVMLTASNANGPDSLTRLAYVQVDPLPPPVADFTGTPLSGFAPLQVTFTDSSTGAPTSWSWDFGDQTSSTQQNPVHVYSGPGTYDVMLTVSNAAGPDSLTRLAYVQVNALPPPPVAGFTGTPLTGDAPLSVTFTDSSTGAPTGWTWDFGDGMGSTQQNPVHVYGVPGDYDVTLTVSNPGGSDFLTRTDYVHVDDPPGPPPTVTRAPLADAPVYEGNVTRNLGTSTALRVRLQNGGSYRSFLKFDLTGLPGTPVSAVLRLFVTDGSNNGGRLYAVSSSSWTETAINWSNQPALGALLDSLGATVVGTWVELDVPASALTGSTASFALADGSSNSGLYSSREGANPPQLVIQTGTPVPPVADFSAIPLSGGAPLSVTFTDLSTGATSWSWTFGDTGTSTAQHPTHVYANPGTYTVTLEVTNALGSSTLTRTDLITVTDPPPVQTFLPVADSRVYEASPNSNYGTDASLRVRLETAGSYHSYVRFDLTSLADPISSAKLRLFVTDGSNSGGIVYPTSGAWTETGIKWSNKPAATGGQVASAGTVGTNVWVEFDVTAAVTAGAPVDFVLQSTSSNSCLYSSREGANPPELVVTTGSP